MFSGKKLHDLRVQKGLTQARLAQMTGLNSPSAVTMYESGERTPPANKLPELARILGCSIDDLFAKEEQTA